MGSFLNVKNESSSYIKHDFVITAIEEGRCRADFFFRQTLPVLVLIPDKFSKIALMPLWLSALPPVSHLFPTGPHGLTSCGSVVKVSAAVHH